MPRNTPVRLPASDSGGTPACSSARHATSSTRRCCGSMETASRGEIPKNSASKRSTSRRNPPQRVRSEEHTSELQSLMRISYAVFCLKKQKRIPEHEMTRSRLDYRPSNDKHIQHCHRQKKITIK